MNTRNREAEADGTAVTINRIEGQHSDERNPDEARFYSEATNTDSASSGSQDMPRLPDEGKSVNAPSPAAKGNPPAAASSQLKVQVLKYQGGDHDFQDAFHHVLANGAVAIADGATISTCQREWAEILTRQFTETFLDLEDEKIQQKWWGESLEEWTNQSARRQEIWREQPAKYYLTTKLFYQVGAGATFLGLSLLPEGSSHRYKLYSVGDCVGFWFERERFVRSEPPIADFDCTPPLLVTRRAFPSGDFQVFAGSALPGDLLVMATDALAEYFVKYRPWEQATDFWGTWWLKSEDDFASWVGGLQQEDLIKPDDYTMVLVRFD